MRPLRSIGLGCLFLLAAALGGCSAPMDGRVASVPDARANDARARIEATDAILAL